MSSDGERRDSSEGRRSSGARRDSGEGRRGFRRPRRDSGQVRSAQADFGAADSNSDGLLSADELRSYLEKSGEDSDLAPLLVAIFDDDGDNQISFPEFLNFYLLCEEGRSGVRKIYERLFRRLDRDGDGFLTVEEVVAFGELIGDPISEDEVKEEIEELDTAGTGKLSIADFLETVE
jgi:Ca2+-binding EF-hand superfamily protein